MKYLFDDWDRVSPKIKNASHIFLCLDYDGTLTPIVSRPELARLPRSVKKTIKILQKKPRFTIAIISGRSLENVERLVGIKGVIYAGNHGLEIRYRGRKIIKSGVISKAASLKDICRTLRAGLKGIKGVKVEDKGCTLSVHYRLVTPEKRALVKKIFADIVRPYVFSKHIRASLGKMVLEARPGLDWDKGKAVLFLLSKNKKALPFYLGDDVTDLDAFRAIGKKGVSIFVGRPKKRIPSDYYLKGTNDVERLLKLLTWI